jgi:glycosyltransferase involved in cell wall biosynthesis
MNMSIVTIFPEARDIHLKKDVGHVVRSLAKKLNIKPVVLTYKNDEKYESINNELSGLELEFIKKSGKVFNVDFSILRYILKNNKKIAVLNAYHPTIASKVYLSLYKILNKNGFAYLKLDLNINHERKSHTIQIPWLKRKINRVIDFAFKFFVDAISVESVEGYELLKEKNAYPVGKMVLVRNGIDKEYVEKTVGTVSFDYKEDIMITVGRIGIKEKNHEMLLEALAKIQFNNWKMIFVGPIEPSFECEIERFYGKNQNLRGNILFVGSINNRQELFQYYLKSKIFILSSISEGFPLVYPEALYFGNFIITTNVSGSQDITRNNTIGKICPIGDVDGFADAIQDRIKTDIQYNEFLDIRKYAEDFYTWDKSVAELGNIINNAKSYN